MESYRRGFAYSSLLSIADNLLAFIPSLLIAYYFGAQSGTDVHFYCLGMISLTIGFCANFNAAVLIPESMRIEAREGVAASQSFLNFFLCLYLGFGLIITLFFVVDPVSAFARISRFERDVLAANAAILQLAIPVMFLQLLVTFLNDILYSRKFFTIPMLSHILNRFVVIGSLVSLHRSLGVVTLMLGLLASYVLQAVLLVGLMVRGLQWGFSVGTIHISRKVVRDILLTGLGGVMSAFSGALPLFLLSGFDAGVITALNFARRLIVVPTTFITAQTSSIVGIRLNELLAHGSLERASEVFRQAIGLLVFVLAPLTLGFVLFRSEVVTLLFKRGAFDAAAVDMTAVFFGLLALALPFMAINTIVARYFMAARRIRPAFCYQLFTSCLLVASIVVGIRLFGVVGYPAVESGFWVTNAFLLYPVLTRIFPELEYGKLLLTLGRILCLNLVVAVGVYALIAWVWPEYAMVRLLFGGLVIGLSVLMLNRVFNIYSHFNHMVDSVAKAFLVRPDAGVRHSD